MNWLWRGQYMHVSQFLECCVCHHPCFQLSEPVVCQYDGNDVGVFTPSIFVALSTKRQLFFDQDWPAYVPLIVLTTKRTRSSLLMTGFRSVQSLSHVQLFATPSIPACQASLSITNSQSFLKLMSIKLVLPSNHRILSRPLLFLTQSFPASGSFRMSQFFPSGGQSIEASASATFFQWIFRVDFL